MKKKLITTIFYLIFLLIPQIGSTQTTCATATLTTVGTCKSGSFASSGRYWYKFVATTTAVKITCTGNYGGAYISLYNTCSTTGLASDKSSGIDEDGRKINYNNLIVGTTYYVEVDLAWDWPAFSIAEYNLCVIANQAPSNDICSTSTDLGCLTEISGEVDKAGAELSDEKNDIWYNFTPASSSGSITLDIGSKFDGVIELWSSCGGTLIKRTNDKVYNTSNYDVTGNAMDETLNYSELTVGKTYSIRIYNNIFNIYGGVHYNKDNSTVEPFKVRVSPASFSKQPIVSSPITYNQYDIASPLSATGSNLEWYDSNLNSLGTSAPTPNTTTLGTVTYYVAQSPNSCVSAKEKIEVIVKTPTVLIIQGFVETFAGSIGGYLDAKGSSAKFNSPAGLTIDDNGFVYVADCYNHRIRKISPDGVVTTVAGNGTAGYASNANGLLAEFNQPTGVAIDASGNIFVTDKMNNRIRKIIPSGRVSSHAGSSTSGSIDGTGTGAQFSSPTGITIDKEGSLYVTMGKRVRKVSPSGDVSTIGGSGTQGLKDGPLAIATFAALNDIAIDKEGNLFVSEVNRIRKISKQGYVSTFAGYNTYIDLGYYDAFTQETQSPGFVNGTGNIARFNKPLGIIINKNNNIIVADNLNSAFREITSDSLVSTYSNSLVGLYNPKNMAVDKANNIYFTTDNTSQIYKLTPPITSFVTDFGTASDAQVIKIAGTLLMQNVLVSSPLGFEISLDPSSGYGNALTIVPTNGEIDSLPVYIRLSATALPKVYNDKLTVFTSNQVVSDLTLNGIVKGKTEQEISFNTLPLKTIGDPQFTLSASASSGLEVTYSSSNTNVATIEGNIVTIIGTGFTTITASQSGNDDYLPAQDVSQELMVCADKPIVTTPISYCQNTVATALTASGTNIRWYLSEEEIEGSAIAPVPSTTEIGSAFYFVSQTMDGCESARSEIVINVTSLPTISIEGTSEICEGESTTLTASGASSYIWSTSGISSTETVSPTEATLYTVTGKDESGCEDTEKITVTVNVCTDIGNANSSSFTLNPNPTSGDFNITTSSIADNIIVMNALGNVISETKPSSLQTPININEFDSGLYFVRVVSGQKSTITKVVKH